MTKRGRWTLAALSAAGFVAFAFDAASTVNANADANQEIAESAPQQSAVEGMAARDALVTGLQMFGVFGALVFINIAAVGPDVDRKKEVGQEWATPTDA